MDSKKQGVLTEEILKIFVQEDLSYIEGLELAMMQVTASLMALDPGEQKARDILKEAKAIFSELKKELSNEV